MGYERATGKFRYWWTICLYTIVLFLRIPCTRFFFLKMSFSLFLVKPVVTFRDSTEDVQRVHLFKNRKACFKLTALVLMFLERFTIMLVFRMEFWVKMTWARPMGMQSCSPSPATWWTNQQRSRVQSRKPTEDASPMFQVTRIRLLPCV